MEQSTTIIEIAKALSKMQGQLKSVPKTQTNPFFKSKYADLDAIWEVCRKPLTDNGLSVVQSTYEQGAKTFLETMILHSSGEWFKSDLDIRAQKQDPQAIGSAITYARRYAMSAMIGISADEDDDAESSMNRNEDKKAPATSQNKQGTEEKSSKDKSHWCAEHKVAFFMRGNMKSFAHPIKDSKDWCSEPKKEDKSVDPPISTTSAKEAPPAQPQQADGQASSLATQQKTASDQAFANIPSAGKATPDQLNKLQDLKKAGINLAAKVKEYGWTIGKMADFTSDQANRLIADYAEKVI
jgi:hypothetical protein